MYLHIYTVCTFAVAFSERSYVLLVIHLLACSLKLLLHNPHRKADTSLLNWQPERKGDHEFHEP